MVRINIFTVAFIVIHMESFCFTFPFCLDLK